MFLKLLLPILFLISSNKASTECPTSCYCDNDSTDYLKINCQSNNLKTAIGFPPEAKVVNFSHNQLEFVLNSTFGQNEQLEVVDLSNNEIFSLAGGLLEGCSNLKEVNLRHNELKFINSVVFEGLQTVQGQNSAQSSEQTARNVNIKLGSNPWHCNCALRKVWQKLSQIPRLTLVDPMTCVTPEKYSNMPISELEEICTEAMSVHDWVIIGLAIVGVVISIAVTIVDDMIVRSQNLSDSGDGDSDFVTDLDTKVFVKAGPIDGTSSAGSNGEMGEEASV